MKLTNEQLQSLRARFTRELSGLGGSVELLRGLFTTLDTHIAATEATEDEGERKRLTDLVAEDMLRLASFSLMLAEALGTLGGGIIEAARNALPEEAKGHHAAGPVTAGARDLWSMPGIVPPTGKNLLN